jgi:Tfp pilus assembly protein PilF
VGRLAGILLLIALIGLGGLMIGPDLWARYHIRATHSALSKQDYDRAWNHVQKALQGRPRSADLHLLAAQVARRSEHMAEAQQHLEKCFELQSGISEPLQIERMMLAAQMGRAETVVEPLFDYVRNDHPSSALILESLCMGFRQLKSGHMAARFAGMWLEREPDNVQALTCHGVCFGELGNFTAAGKDFERAFQIAPDHPGCRLNLGIVRLEMAQFRTAAELFEQVVAAEPDNTSALLGLAQCKVAMNEHEQAQAILDGMIEREQEGADVLVERGKVALQLGQPDVALKWTRKAYEKDPYHHTALYQLELCFRIQGKTKEANEIGQQLVHLEEEMRRLQELMTEVISRPGPHRPGVYQELGEISVKRGDKNQAFYWLYKALERDPMNKQAHTLLADVHEKVGNTERANEHRDLAQGKVPRRTGP